MADFFNKAVADMSRDLLISQTMVCFNPYRVWVERIIRTINGNMQSPGGQVFNLKVC